MEAGGRMATTDIDARFTAMFERHYNEVLAYCVRRTNRAEADDVTAEVFAVAWRRRDDIEWETVRPWLYGVARGVLSNRWRSLKRQDRLAKKMASMAPASGDAADVVVVRRSQDTEVVGVLQTLKPSDQEILMLAAWEELTAPEVAVTLGISTSAAEQRLHRAKRRFAAKLEHKRPHADSFRAARQEGGR